MPCWVREMDDAAAYMELVRANAQGELTALERGMHALHSKLSLQAYADQAGIKNRQTVAQQIWAAKVLEHCKNIFTGDPSDYFMNLSVIHPSPEWLWPALVTRMVSDGLTVDATRKMVAEVKDAPEPPEHHPPPACVASARDWRELRDCPRSCSV